MTLPDASTWVGVYTHKFGVCWGCADDCSRAERRRGGGGAPVGVAVDESEEGGGVGSDGESAEQDQSHEDIIHATGEGIASDNAISDSSALPPTISMTTWSTPCTW